MSIRRAFLPLLASVGLGACAGEPTTPPSADTAAPSVPTGLTATPIAPLQITLTWTASTDNVGVTGYRVERCQGAGCTSFAQVGTPTGTPYADPGLTASTAYTYRVRAADAAGNVSVYSTTVSGVTQAGGGGTADANWQARSTAPGVILAEGFDSMTALSSCGGNWPTTSNSRCYENATAGSPFLDTTVYASGGKSLLLDATSAISSNMAGDYFIRWPQEFAQNSHFYVQYRMRVTGLVSGSSPWTSPSLGGQGWKTSVFANQSGPLCGGVELATVNFYYTNELRLYTRCGGAIGDSFDLPADGLYGFTPNWLYQQGDYRCAYSGTPNRQTDCAMFHGDQWMTFYYDVQIGTWDTNSSYVKAYVDYGDGQGYRQWIDAPNYKLSSNYGTGAYGLIDLTLYNTSKTTANPAGTYKAWYDELIVSTQPIAAPGP